MVCGTAPFFGREAFPSCSVSAPPVVSQVMRVFRAVANFAVGRTEYQQNDAVAAQSSQVRPGAPCLPHGTQHETARWPASACQRTAMRK